MSEPIKATPRQLHANWSISQLADDYILHLKKDQEYVVRWLNLHTDFMLIMSMLDKGFKAIEHIDFNRIEELAAAYPALAKRLANPDQEVE